MALASKALFRNCNFIVSLSKPVKWNVTNSATNYSLRGLSSGICFKNIDSVRPNDDIKRIDFITIRKCMTEGPKKTEETTAKPAETKGLKGLVLKFKQMYRDYWYVLLPVHLGTSAIWYGSFYYAVRSGVDVISILESIGISDTLLEPLKKTGAGYFALALAMYKLITPLRYTVTIAGTTYAIKRLTAIGLIKPVPSRERLKEMIQEKKDNFQDRFNESKQQYHKQMQEKKTQVMDEMRRYKMEIRNAKNKVKKM